MKRPGKVFLVGAGPGDPGLMTVRGAQILRDADVIVMDALVNPAVLAGSRGRVIDAGKRGRSKRRPGHGPLQSVINATLIRFARRGNSVVRLKGGDPFVFGRGSEEVEALRAAGISFEIVPGVSSAVAVPAYAGIPVTDRRWSSQVTFVTGHERLDGREEGGVDWKRLSPEGTLVVLMGVTGWPSVARRLIAEGWSGRTPVAAIERGTTPSQRVVRSTLAASPDAFSSKKVAAPAVIVVGAVAALSARLDWFSRERPLAGRRIAVTRAADQSEGLAALLSAEGAEVIRCPLIEVRPLFSEEMRRVRDGYGSFDWIVFLSANAVRHFTDFLDGRARPRAKVAVVGPQTAEAATAAGWRVSRVAERFDASGLARSLGSVRGKRLLLPRAAAAPESVVRTLRRAGADVTVAPVYETRRLTPPADAVRAVLESADAVTFLSASTVEAFRAAVPAAGRARLFRRAPAVSIGPSTTRALRVAGVANVVEARASSRAAVMDALRRLFRAK